MNKGIFWLSQKGCDYKLHSRATDRVRDESRRQFRVRAEWLKLFA